MASMTKNSSLLLAVLTTILLVSSAIATRNLPFNPTGLDLAARLEASGGMIECWNALMELKSCTNEIVLFFLNGETKIGSGCCGAIEIITKNCWPAMLTSVGFTAEEGNILRGYCDASAAASPAVPPTAVSPV